jgi:hypothetical protein
MSSKTSGTEYFWQGRVFKKQVNKHLKDLRQRVMSGKRKAAGAVSSQSSCKRLRVTNQPCLEVTFHSPAPLLVHFVLINNCGRCCNHLMCCCLPSLLFSKAEIQHLRAIADVCGGSIRLADYLATATFLLDVDQKKLKTLADWRLPGECRRSKGDAAVLISSFVENGQRTIANAFFYAELGLHPNAADRLLGVTSALVDDPIALVAYQLHAVKSKLVAYVSLIATRPGSATDLAVGKESWRGRGLGRLLIHLVARITMLDAGLRPVHVELQCDCAVSGLLSFYESCGFRVVQELVVNTKVWDGFTRMRWSPSICRTPPF